MYWMIKVMAIGMDCLSSMLLLAPAALVFQKVSGRRMFSVHTLFLLFYVGVLGGIFSVTGLPTLKYFQFDLSVNLIPMTDILSSPGQYVLNVLMFVPVGFLLPLLWEKYGDWKQVLGFGCFLTLFIEIAQVFTFRTTDIDDLITNLLGTGLGFQAVKILGERMKVPLPLTLPLRPDGRSGRTAESWILLLIVFLIYFFIQPCWSAFFWDHVLI